MFCTILIYLRILFSAIRKMLEEVYTVYLPKKTYPWCYISLDINPQNIDVNIHPTKHEVRFLHEDAIIERIRLALDERLTGSNASRSFYLQARLPKVDITKEVLKEVLPEYDKRNSDQSKKIYAKELVRTDSADQKLDKFNFTIQTASKQDDSNPIIEKSIHNSELEALDSEFPLNKDVPKVVMENPVVDNKCQEKESDLNVNTTEHRPVLQHIEETAINDAATNWSSIIDNLTSETQDSTSTVSKQNNQTTYVCPEDSFDISEILHDLDEPNDCIEDRSVDAIADKARKQVQQYFGSRDINGDGKRNSEKEEEQNILQDIKDNEKKDENSESIADQAQDTLPIEENTSVDKSIKSLGQFKSYSINNFKHDVKLTSILRLRKEIEDERHDGLREILSNLTFVGCIDETSALIQSGVNLYICDTRKLT